MTYERRVTSDLIHIKSAVEDALGFLRENLPGIDARCLWEFKLILSELIVNSVIHGNLCDSSKYVSIKLEIVRHMDDEFVSCEIADEGSGFDYLLYASKSVDNESPDGRGIRIVNTLSDRISFNKAGNKISLLKKVVND